MEQKNKQEQQKNINLTYLKTLLPSNPNKMNKNHHNYNIFYEKLKEVFLAKNNCSFDEKDTNKAKTNVIKIFECFIGNFEVEEKAINNYAELTAGLLACGALDKIELNDKKIKVINMAYKMLDDKSDEAFKKIGQLVAFFNDNINNDKEIIDIVEQLYQLYLKNNEEGKELLKRVISYIQCVKDKNLNKEGFTQYLSDLRNMIAEFNENTNQKDVRNLVFGYLHKNNDYEVEKLKEATKYIAAVKKLYAKEKMNQKYMPFNNNGVSDIVFIKKFDTKNLSDNEIKNLCIIYKKYYKQNKTKNYAIYKKYYENKINSSINTLLKEGFLMAELSENYVINLVKLHAHSDEKAKKSLITLVGEVGHKNLKGIFENDKFIDHLVKNPQIIKSSLDLIKENGNLLNDVRFLNFLKNDKFIDTLNKNPKRTIQFLEMITRNNKLLDNSIDDWNHTLTEFHKIKDKHNDLILNQNNNSNIEIKKHNEIEIEIKKQIAKLTSEQARKDAIMAAKTMEDIEVILSTKGLFWGKSSALTKFYGKKFQEQLKQCSSDFRGKAKDPQASGYKKLRTFMRFFGIGRSKLGKNESCFGLNRIMGTKTDAKAH